MKPLPHLSAAIALSALLLACQEQITTPVDCPELCPGTSLTVRDTVLSATAELDSTFTGYINANDISALLVSNGIDAGEARGFVTFGPRSDSVFVDGIRYHLPPDSMAVAMQVLARDTLATGVKLYIYRVAPDLDTTVTLADLDAQMTPATLVDSASVPDSLKDGVVRAVLTGDAISRLTPTEAEAAAGRIGLGFRVGGAVPTGIRLGAINSSLGPPSIITWGKVAILDTTKIKQSTTYHAETANYVIVPPPIGVDRLWLGGKSAARIILRFTLPANLKDSASVLRATLELTPARPVPGLRTDSPSLEVRGVLIDLGAKSPALANVTAGAFVDTGLDQLLSIDVQDIVSTWFNPGPTPPTALFMAIIPEGSSFTRPEFLSTRAASGAPRLRITYALPSRPGHP